MADYRGRLSDGKSAASRDVTVRFGRALEISAPGATAVESWAFHRLHTAAPVDRDANEALVTSADHPGMLLFLRGDGVARELLRLAPQLSNAATRWRWLKPMLAVALVLGGLVAALYAIGFSPARAIAGLLPDSFRNKIGDAVANSLAGDHRDCTSAAGVAALKKLNARLMAATGQAVPYRVKVVDWDLVNAFAVPGEQIVVSRGLIDEAKHPDEVAGVIAHEIGHGLERHPETGIVRALGLSIALEVAAGGSAGTLGNMAALLLQLRYTREAEREADGHAISILKGAGISSKPLADFFNRLEAKEGDGGDPGAAAVIFATHPRSADRAKLAVEAGDYPATPALTDPEWQALRAICKV